MITDSSSRLTSEQVDELAAFVDRLSAAVASAGLGEVDGLVDEDDELTVYCYGDDVERLMTFVHEQDQEVAPEARTPRRSVVHNKKRQHLLSAGGERATPMGRV